MGYVRKKVLKCRMNKRMNRGCLKGSLGQSAVTTVKHKAFKDTKKQ